MKKLTALLLALTLCLLAFTACGKDDGDKNTDNTPVKINIGVMSGPTGMGMAKLINDNGQDSDKYGFTVYSSPDAGTTDLASGKLDMLCLPTNAAANISNKKADYISVISINCLGSLYLVTDDTVEVKGIEDLAGKTIYTSVATSTTKPIIEYILKENDISAEIVVELDHDVLVAKLVSGEAPIAVLPEPKVSAALISNPTCSVDLNISEEWSKISETPLTMGCIVVRNDFLKANKSSVDAFLSEYKASIEYINDKNNTDSAAEMIVAAGVLPKLPVAKKALGNLYGSIVYQDGEAMKNSLVAFYNAIGCALPSDSFYYEK